MNKKPTPPPPPPANKLIMEDSLPFFMCLTVGLMFLAGVIFFVLTAIYQGNHS